VSYADVGVSSSLAMFSRTIGQVFGPALGGTLLVARFQSHALSLVGAERGSTLDFEQLRTKTDSIKALEQPVQDQIVQAYRLAVNDAFRLAAVISLLGVVVSLFMREIPLRESIHDEAEPVNVFE
jgi:hypothetical protein